MCYCFWLQFHQRVGYVGLIYFVAAVGYILGALSSGILADKLVGWVYQLPQLPSFVITCWAMCRVERSTYHLIIELVFWLCRRYQDTWQWLVSWLLSLDVYLSVHQTSSLHRKWYMSLHGNLQYSCIWSLMGWALVSPTLTETALHMALCVCLLACLLPLTVNFKWAHLYVYIKYMCTHMHFSLVMW